MGSHDLRSTDRRNRASNFVNVQCRGVGAEESVWFVNFIELLEDLKLNVHGLEDCFDNEIAVL